jgi:hypothetical protein
MNERFRKSFETQIIEQHLSGLAIGQTATYAELGKLVGRAVDGAYAPLQSARAMLERSGTHVFGTLTKVGVKRLSDAEIVAATHGGRARVARAARNELRKLGNIQSFAALSEADKRAHQAHAVIFAAIADKASSSNAKTLIATVNIDGQAMLAALKEAARK